MWRSALLALFGISFLSLWGQGGDTPACLPHDEFAPVLVKNPGMKVTFKCDHATPLELIRAVGFQTRLPIGLVLGRDCSLANYLAWIFASYLARGGRRGHP
jgi:hypothetical protein